MTSGRATFAGGFRVRFLAETGSTNADLAEAARSGEPAGLVLVADHQTAGKGRLGRRWEAQPGSALLVSVLVEAPPTSPLHLATVSAGLAARAACRTVAGVEPELKWPNDLVHGDRKLAGILAELVMGEAGRASVVVGMGLNLHSAGLPPDGVVVLDELAGRRVERDDLLAAWLEELVPCLRMWRDDPRALAANHRAALGTIGRAVRVELPAATIVGTALDVTDDGELVVATEEGTAVVVGAGDIVHLRAL